MRFNAITLICILLLIGPAGKSAQIGLHTWSPDAMEATTVIAGGFMIAWCSPLFEYPPTAFIVITSAGATTSFLAATTGILQNDSKRVITYSTCTLLFLSAGSVIHAMSDEQDMRKMGGLASSFPLTYAMMLMGSLSLIGFPFLTGFYSKDVILELAYTKYTISGNFAFWLGSVSILFTSYYSFRLLFLTFLVPTYSSISGYSNKSCFLWFSYVETSVPIRSIRNRSPKHSIREPGLDSSVWYSFSFGSWNYI
ncbi:hypothetical protein MKW92_007386 [Papaver armeniacum]|nr:hypothetical protein MKW92_007386 [Papaver armeniacum]